MSVRKLCIFWNVHEGKKVLCFSFMSIILSDILEQGVWIVLCCWHMTLFDNKCHSRKILFSLLLLGYRRSGRQFEEDEVYTSQEQQQQQRYNAQGKFKFRY